MGAEAAPIIRLLSRLAEQYGPEAAGELGAPEVGSAFRALTSEETPVGTRAFSQNWLQKLLGASGGENPAASTLRAQGPTVAPPGAPAAQVAPSPAKPLKMALMQKLQAYEPYGRQFGEAAETESPAYGVAPSTPPPEAAPLSLAKAQAGAQGNVPSPGAPSPMSAGEMLQRPMGAERQDMMSRLKDYLSAYKGGDEGAMPALQRLRAVFRDPGAVDPKTTQGLGRVGAVTEEPPSFVPEDFPVTRLPYRGAPRQGTANVPPEQAFQTEGLKQTNLPPELKDFVSQLEASGQLPKDVLSQENTNRALLAKLYGYKPRALLGGEKTVGEAAPSRVGLMLQRFSELDPDQITKILGSVKPSGIYRMGRLQESAEQAAPSYKALGEPGSVEEIVANLLRGGPKPTGPGAFSEKALTPILKRRQQLGLQAGQPLSVDDVLQTLMGGANKFVRASQPSPARLQLLQKVIQMMKEKGAGVQ